MGTLPWETKQTNTYKNTGEIYDFTTEDNSIFFSCNEGILRIKVISSNCIRITFNCENKFLNIPSFAVVKEPAEKNFSVREEGGDFVISTSEIQVVIGKKDGLLTISDLKGNILSEDMGYGFCWTKDLIKCNKKMSSNTHFYGLGEKTGFLDKRGRKYVMWNTDDHVHTPTKDPLYQSVPLLIALDEKCASGIFVDSTCKIVFDLGEESREYFSFDVWDHEIDYYFIYGPDIKRVVGAFGMLTGTMELPPAWSMGYQQSRWSYFPEDVVRNLANSFREKDIPCDVIYLDIDFMDGYRVFTWDNNRFPNPEKMLQDLKDKGFKVITIVDPGIKKDPEYEVYVEGIQKGLFCKWATGEVYHGTLTPGEVAFPDFSKEETRLWWGEKHRALFSKGVAGIWNDKNEPSNFIKKGEDIKIDTIPNDVIMDNDGHPRTFTRYHNSYALNMCRGTSEGFKKYKPDERPFILTRSAYAGIQRYAAVWTGDNNSWWEHLAYAMPSHMNIGMSGIPFVGCDMGGFIGNASPEMYARWMQMGAFTPLFRAHSSFSSKPHEPWTFGKETEDICRKYIKLRYRLLPYNYNEFYKAGKTGLPIMRPLVLEYPDDENVHNLCDQYLYGENIMVAPVYRPSTIKRCVYIPEGTWYNYWTGERYEGKNYILADAPLDVLPIYIKEGSIIPTIPEMNYTGEKPADVLILDIYPGEQGLYTLYEDDGSSYKYREGEYNLTSFEKDADNKAIIFKIRPVLKGYKTDRIKYHLRFHNICACPSDISGNGILVQQYDERNKIFNIFLNDIREEQVCTLTY